MVVRNEPRWGYNSKKRGRPSYLPLVCFEGNTQDCWEGSYHPGDTHGSTIRLQQRDRDRRDGGVAGVVAALPTILRVPLEAQHGKARGAPALLGVVADLGSVLPPVDRRDR